MPVSVLVTHAALLARLAPWPSPYPFAVGETLELRGKAGVLPGRDGAPLGERDGPGARGRRVRLCPAGARAARRGSGFGDELTSWVGFERVRLPALSPKDGAGGSVQEQRYQIVPDSSRYREEGGLGDWAAPRMPWTSWPFSTICGPRRSRPGEPTPSPATSGPATTRSRSAWPAARPSRCPTAAPRPPWCSR